jgi:hypothetical protein
MAGRPLTDSFRIVPVVLVRLDVWCHELRADQPNLMAKIAAVALANKNARIVWAMLLGGTFYEHAPSVKAA